MIALSSRHVGDNCYADVVLHSHVLHVDVLQTDESAC